MSEFHRSGPMRARRSAVPRGVLWILCALWMGCGLEVAEGGEADPSRASSAPFITAHPVSSLFVLPVASLSGPAEQTLAASLQGLVARHSPKQLYLAASGGYSIWHQDLRDKHGISLTDITNLWQAIEVFRDIPKGYVLYDGATYPGSRNIATTLCGPLNAVAVDVSLEARVQAMGLRMKLADVGSHDSSWAWRQRQGEHPPELLVEQRDGLALALRDYAVMANAYVFFDGNSNFRRELLSGRPLPRFCLGWGDATHGEESFIGMNSSNGVSMIPADHALNLSTLSGVRSTPLHQSRSSRLPDSKGWPHYVCFLITDGDNVQWNLGGMPSYFQHPVRGTIEMGWGISPALAVLAPSAMQWYYEESRRTGSKDRFVAGPSGLGYYYPSQMPSAFLKEQLAQLNTLMERADLGVVQILDFHAFRRLDLWNQYTALPSVSALLYLEYSPYHGASGAIQFSNGKPVIAARNVLWKGLCEEEELIRILNQAPRNPASETGYSLVAVHAWSKSLNEVKKVVAGLHPSVRVVNPETFAAVIQQNLGSRAAPIRQLH